MVDRKTIEIGVIAFFIGILITHTLLTPGIKEKKEEIQVLQDELQGVKENISRKELEIQILERELLGAKVDRNPDLDGFWFQEMVTFYEFYEKNKISEELVAPKVRILITSNWFNEYLDHGDFIAGQKFLMENPDWFQDIFDIVLDFRTGKLKETEARLKISEYIKNATGEDRSVLKYGVWFKLMAGEQVCSWRLYPDIDYPLLQYQAGDVTEEELKEIFNWVVTYNWFSKDTVVAKENLKDPFFQYLLTILGDYDSDRITADVARDKINRLLQIEGEPEVLGNRNPLSHGLWFPMVVTLIDQYNGLKIPTDYAEMLLLEIFTDNWFGGNEAKGMLFNETAPKMLWDIYSIVIDYRMASVGGFEARERIQEYIQNATGEELTIIKNGVWFKEMFDVLEKYKAGDISEDEAKLEINKVTIGTWFGRNSEDAMEILNSPAFFPRLVEIFDDYGAGMITENQARELIKDLMQ